MVEARTLSNAAPSFAEQDDDEATTPYIEVARSVAENTATSTAIGRAVSALDADGDILFYELLDTPDLEDEGDDARFTIDSLFRPDKGWQGAGRRCRRAGRRTW